MTRSCRYILLLLVVINSGCASFWHDLKPHRLHRLNRGSAPALDPEFTHSGQPSRSQLVRLDRLRQGPVIKANSAEVTLARGQNVDFEPGR